MTTKKASKKSAKKMSVSKKPVESIKQPITGRTERKWEISFVFTDNGNARKGLMRQKLYTQKDLEKIVREAVTKALPTTAYRGIQNVMVLNWDDVRLDRITEAKENVALLEKARKWDEHEAECQRQLDVMPRVDADNLERLQREQINDDPQSLVNDDEKQDQIFEDDEVDEQEIPDSEYDDEPISEQENEDVSN